MAKKDDQGRRSVIGMIFRVLGVLLIIAVNGVILWRIFSSGDPSSVQVLQVNQQTADAYRENGHLTILYSDQTTITKAEKNYGYFGVTQWRYIEEASQIQLVFRYNNSTIRHLQEDYALESLPDRKETLYDVTLYVAYDLTPEDTTDNDGNNPESVRFQRYTPDSACIGSAQKNVYNYRTYLFDGITIDETVLAVYVDIYYINDIAYEKEPYGTLCLYDYKTLKQTLENEKLDKNDIRALDAYMEKAKGMQTGIEPTTFRIVRTGYGSNIFQYEKRDV